MHSTFVRSASLLVFVVSLGPASAGIINLTSGSFEPMFASTVGSGGPVHFEGDRGFTFDGSVGSVDEGSQILGCDFCTPGATIHLFAGGFPPGTATLEGLSFTTVGIHSGGFNLLEFHMGGDVVAPPFGASSTATLVVPLTFSGFFDHLIDPAVPPVWWEHD